MSRGNMDKEQLNSAENDVFKEKKKVLSHCTNLECQKEQLLILIEKLYKISGERVNLISNEQKINPESYLFSIGDQLNQAISKKKNIDKEILEARQRLEEMEKLMKAKKQG